jgi:hypothetical protein
MLSLLGGSWGKVSQSHLDVTTHHLERVAEDRVRGEAVV